MGEQLQNLTKTEINALIDLLQEQRERFLSHKLGLEPIKTLATDLALIELFCELLNSEIKDRNKKQIETISKRK